jgi:IS5 family transposase
MRIDELLDDPKVMLAVTNDLARSAPEARWNGRPATPVEVTLRVAVARRLMNWGYRAAESEVAGSGKWRWFCRVYSQPVPDHTTLRDREALIRPATLKRVNARLLKVAQDHRVTRGDKLRTDGTVMETDIHYPTDSRLLDDSVRCWLHVRGISPCSATVTVRRIDWRARLPNDCADKRAKKRRKRRRNGSTGNWWR